MSEFSEGYFAKNENKEKIYPYLTKEELLIQLNEKWVGKLSELDCEDPQPKTVALSNDVPLLYLSHAEDHGFDIMILHKEDVKFEFYLSYELEYDVYAEIAVELYGENWTEIVGWHHEKIKVESGKRMPDIINQIFADINLERLEPFKLFGISEENIAKIADIFTVKNYNESESLHDIFADLVHFLGLEEFHWISHRYCSRDDSRVVKLNR